MDILLCYMLSEKLRAITLLVQSYLEDAHISKREFQQHALPLILMLRIRCLFRGLPILKIYKTAVITNRSIFNVRRTYFMNHVGPCNMLPFSCFVLLFLPTVDGEWCITTTEEVAINEVAKVK